MTKATRVIALLLLGTCLRAQQFDAVSIKPNVSGAQQRSFRAMPTGQIVATNVSTRQINANAYNMPDFLITGGPDWLASDRFDLVATSDRPQLRPDDLRQMLRAVLADRFTLRAQVVTREMPIYALVLARSDRAFGPQFKEVPGPCDPAQPNRQCGFTFNGSRLSGSRVTMPRLAQELS